MDICSHAHWDHCRAISPEFPQATAFFGPGTKDFCSPGHMVDGKACDDVEWDGRYFDGKGYATERWEEFSGPWKRFGPFDKVMDFFGDGSFLIVDAPGHMPGNLCALVRLDASRGMGIAGRGLLPFPVSLLYVSFMSPLYLLDWREIVMVMEFVLRVLTANCSVANRKSRLFNSRTAK